MAMKAMKSATKTMATKAMKAIQAKTATKTRSTRTMKAKTAMKTMSTRAMKAKKAKTALKTMSKKAMQAMKAKKVGRKSQAMKTKKVGLNKQDDPLGPIDLALSIHEDRHDSPKRPIAPMALRTQRLHQANSPKKWRGWNRERWNRELEQAEAEEQAKLEKQRAMTEGLEETKHHDDLTKYHDDDLIKYHDDDPGHAGLQETQRSTTTMKQIRVKKDLLVHVAITKKDNGKRNDTTTKDTTTTTTETTADGDSKGEVPQTADPDSPWWPQTPWPCARCNLVPVDTVWRALDGATPPFDTEERICEACWKARHEEQEEDIQRWMGTMGQEEKDAIHRWMENMAEAEKEEKEEVEKEKEANQRRRKKATTSKSTSAASTSAASKAAPKAASTGAPLIKARPLPKPRTSTEHVVAKPRPKPRTKSTEHVWTQTTWMMAPKDVVIITEREAGTTWNDAETQTEGILIIKDQGLRGRFGCVAEKGGASSVAAGSDASSVD